MLGIVIRVGLLVLYCSEVSQCFWWDFASDVLQAAAKTLDDYEYAEEIYREKDTFNRVVALLQENDKSINLESPDTLGWKKVFEAGSQIGQFVMDSVDESALEDVLPDLTSYGLDLQYVRDHLNTWNWEKYTNDLVESLDEDEKGDAYSREIDEIADSIHAFPSFEASEKGDGKLPPECFMTVPQIIRFAGYPCSVYSTVTKDGYKITMHRIPFGSTWAEKEDGRFESFEDNGNRKLRGRRSRRGRAKRPVVFLQHGILSDSSCWVSNGPKRSLAFILADAGFDVWMGNVRGNTYSRDHVRFDPDKDEQYWRFSWQQMAEFDLPAMIDSVLRATGQENLCYIGHSQGTLIAFAHLSENEEFNEKIRLMIALAPIASLQHIKSPVKFLTTLADVAQFGVSLFGGAEILPSSKISQWLSAKLHRLAKDDPLVYQGNNLLLFLTGFNMNHYHKDRIPVFLAKTPSGTSLHNLLHMSQLVKSGKTQKWDYGTVGRNIDMYGISEPPLYNLMNISTSIALFLGSKDDLAVPKDGRNLASTLKNLVHFRMIRGWDHLDFLWGKDAPSLLYNDIVGYIRGLEEPNKKERKVGFRHIRGVDDEL